jgi:hypothetical protein
MILSKIKKNCKTWQTTIIEIVVAFLLFLLINDKSIFNNIFNTCTKFPNLSLDALIYEVVHIGHVCTFHYCLQIIVTLLVGNIAILGVIACFIYVNKSDSIEIDDASKVTYNSSQNDNYKRYNTNKLYLIKNNILC